MNSDGVSTLHAPVTDTLYWPEQNTVPVPLSPFFFLSISIFSSAVQSVTKEASSSSPHQTPTARGDVRDLRY